MNKVKEFYAKHKKKIIIGGCVVGGAIIGSLITKGRFKMKYGDLRGKMGIIWEPENKFIYLEKAKEILDLNVDNASRFAIYKQKIWFRRICLYSYGL
jgi:hypothetical protein